MYPFFDAGILYAHHCCWHLFHCVALVGGLVLLSYEISSIIVHFLARIQTSTQPSHNKLLDKMMCSLTTLLPYWWFLWHGSHFLGPFLAANTSIWSSTVPNSIPEPLQMALLVIQSSLEPFLQAVLPSLGYLDILDMFVQVLLLHICPSSSHRTTI